MPGNFLDELFYPGNTVQVEYYENPRSKLVILTSVQSISDQTIQLLVTNEANANQTPVKPGIILLLKVREKSTAQVYYYSSKLIEYRPGNPVLLVIKRPPLSQTLSRRNFFRCEVDFPFSFWVNKQEVKGQVKNLSASGLYGTFEVKLNLKLGMILPIEFKLPTYEEPISLEAKIVRSHKTDQKGVWGIALHFHNQQEKIENIIIKYLFQRQRELIQSGQIKVAQIE